MKSKSKNKFYISCLLFLVVLMLLFLYFYYLKQGKQSNKNLYNVTSGDKIGFIDNPDSYNKDDIMSLLKKKTLELSSSKDEKAYCKIIFTSGDGDFDGEYLDNNNKTKLISTFKGKFKVLEKLDKLTYKLEVSEINLENEDKLDELSKIEDLIFVFPNQFRLKNQFILRLPNTKIYSLIDGYEKYDFQNIVTDTLNVFSLETGGYVYYEKVELK